MDDNRFKPAKIDPECLGKGSPPEEIPAKVAEFHDLEKKSIDTLIDAIKYFATTAGIALPIYSQYLQVFIKKGIKDETLARIIVFAPVVFWLSTILTSVFAIFPRKYDADTDLKKEQAVIKIRERKRFWTVIALYLFVLGFSFFVYIMAAQLWKIYPFN